MALDIPSNSPFNYGDYFDPEKLNERFKTMFGDDFGDIDFETYYGDFDTELADVQARGQALQDWTAEFQCILNSGDGNAAVDHIIEGYKNGTITKEQAIQFASQVQQIANQNGGGKINGGQRQKLQDALGIDFDPIAPGKTRFEVGWDNFWGGVGDFFMSL